MSESTREKMPDHVPVMSIDQIKAMLVQLEMKPLKTLGQNFLVSERVVTAICKKVKSLEPKSLLEIGPGLGALTRALLVYDLIPVVIEFDRKIAEYWRTQKLEVIEGDALRIDYSILKHDVLVSNLPYQISSSLVIELSIYHNTFENLILMFQKEVAQRLMAAARSEHYGLLSVIAQNFWEMENLVEAGPKDFYPPPKIVSRVVTFKRKESNLKERKKFLSFVKVAFSQRRKKMTSNLKAWPQTINLLQYLSEMGFNDNTRAEELSAKQFAQLFEKLCQTI